MKNKDKNTLIQLQNLYMDDLEEYLDNSFEIIEVAGQRMCESSNQIRSLKSNLDDSQTINILFSVIGILSGLAIGLLI